MGSQFEVVMLVALVPPSYSKHLEYGCSMDEYGVANVVVVHVC